MQLLRLRLVNFRQHADTELEFGPGITGIIGPNGSGKTSILEAIAWALYGVQAVRGDKDSIRRLGAKGRAGVEVDLEFRLGAHEYRVKRGLSTAVLHQDGQVIANSLKAVTDKLERTLGMSHDEFFNTYFTGQKELAVMAALGKTERAAFLSRVLGYERLREAQERVREVRNGVADFAHPLLRLAQALVPEHARQERRPLRLAECRHHGQLLLAREVGVEELVVAHSQRALQLVGDRLERIRDHLAVLVEHRGGEPALHAVLVGAESELEVHLDARPTLRAEPTDRVLVSTHRLHAV